METKPHKKLSAMPVLLLVWLPYDVITLDSFTLKSNRGQAIQQCFRNMFTGIPTITHFWHIIQNTERERISCRHNHSRWSYIIGIDCRRTGIRYGTAICFQSEWHSPNHKVNKRCQMLIGRLDQMCHQFWNNLCFEKAMYPVIHVHLEGSSKEHAGKNGCLVQ